MTVHTKQNKRDVKKSTPVGIKKGTGVGMSTMPEAVVSFPGDPIGNLPYRDLQAMAKERGLKANGSTEDLIARINTA